MPTDAGGELIHAATLPYGKFVHGLYRFLASVKYAGKRKTGTFIE